MFTTYALVKYLYKVKVQEWKSD